MDFVSYYIELPIMVLMFVIWKLVKRTKFVKASEMDLVTDTFTKDEKEIIQGGWKEKGRRAVGWIF